MTVRKYCSSYGTLGAFKRRLGRGRRLQGIGSTPPHKDALCGLLACVACVPFDGVAGFPEPREKAFSRGLGFLRLGGELAKFVDRFGAEEDRVAVDGAVTVLADRGVHFV